MQSNQPINFALHVVQKKIYEKWTTTTTKSLSQHPKVGYMNLFLSFDSIKGHVIINVKD